MTTANTNVTGTSGFPNAIAIHYSTQLLDWLKADLMLDQFGQMKKLPKNKGNQIYFTRYTPFTADTNALSEGVTPDGQELQSAQIDATPVQYGNYCTMSDFLQMETIDPVIESANELLAYQAALSLDTIIRNTLHSNVTNQFANGQSQETDVAAVMTATEIRKAVYTLKKNKVKRIKGDFVAVIDPAQSHDLQGETATGAWLDLNKYTTNGPLYKGEIGKMYGARLVETHNAGNGVGAEAVATYRAFMFGDGAYGLVELAGANLEMIAKQLGSEGSGDPLNQRSSVGYKFSHVTKVLDANRAIEIYTASNV